MYTHPEPGILESEAKWARGNITTNRGSAGDGIPAELFQILKHDAVKVLHSISQQIWKTHQWPQDLKKSIFISIPKKGNAKECSNYLTIVLISHDSKVILNSDRLFSWAPKSLRMVAAAMKFLSLEEKL